MLISFLVRPGMSADIKKELSVSLTSTAGFHFVDCMGYRFQSLLNTELIMLSTSLKTVIGRGVHFTNVICNSFIRFNYFQLPLCN